MIEIDYTILRESFFFRKEYFTGISLMVGQFVNVFNGAANRDPEIFLNPHILDLNRTEAKKHIAFGFGPHVCLGAALTYLEAEVGFRVLLERMPNLQLAQENIEYLPTPVVRALKELYVS